MGGHHLSNKDAPLSKTWPSVLWRPLWVSAHGGVEAERERDLEGLLRCKLTVLIVTLLLSLV